MAYRLWSMDPEAGEAVIQGGDAWYFVSSDNGWRPFEIDMETAVGWWLSGASVEEGVGDYGTLEEAVEAVRERFLAFRGPAPPSLSSRPGSESVLPRSANQAMRFYVALRAGGFLKIFGCGEAESAELKAKVVRHFQGQVGSCESKHELDVAILRWAREIYLRRFGEKMSPKYFSALEPEGSQESPRWADEARVREEKRFKQMIKDFPQTVVRCLALWSDEGGYGVQEISKLMRLPKEEVKEHLDWAADRLDLALERLRNPVLARACRQLTAGRGGDG